MSENPFSPPEESTPLVLATDSSPLADRGTRFGAMILDNVIPLVAGLPGFLIAVVAPVGQDLLSSIGLLLAVAGYLAITVYNWWLISQTGQTLGKRWSYIRIVKLDGSPPGFLGGVVLRNWLVLVLTQIPYVGGFIGLADAAMILADDRRCLHDHLAGTKVVRA